MSKKQLGQYFTTNQSYILQNMFIQDEVETIIEPFCGNGDLLDFLKNSNKEYIIETYDIDVKLEHCIKRDTLLEPPDYIGKFVLTNPPYLALNKSKNEDKSIYRKYNCNDLYKCFIKSICNFNSKGCCDGGIVIIPLNFWCSIRKNDIALRDRFLKYYKVLQINIFEEQVFNDTGYTICSMQFKLRENSDSDSESENIINCTIYPIKKNIEIKLTKQNNYLIGGELYKLKQNPKIKIERLTRLNKNNEKENITNILVKCIDDNNENRIAMIYDENRYVDNTVKLSARTYATLIIKPSITIATQKKLVAKFNDFLAQNREKYHSLFLTNYREDSRKRISFKLVFEIANYLLNILETQND